MALSEVSAAAPHLLAAEASIGPDERELLSSVDLDYGKCGAVIRQDPAAESGLRGFVHLRALHPIRATGTAGTEELKVTTPPDPW